MKGKKLTQKKRAKKMKGGNTDNIAHTLLLNSILPYLPTTETVKSESNVRDYLSSMDALTLLEIVGGDEKYMSSKSLNYLIDSIDRNTMEMIKTMGESLKVPQLRKDIETFEIDCLKLAKKTNVKDLLELPNYLLDCNDELCNRNLNWYDIILGFRKLDDDYEELVRKEIIHKKIIINTNKSLTSRERLRRNTKVRGIMKRRLLKCCNDPRSFFSKIKGTVAWVDYNQCTSCKTKDCVLYIDDNYKNFLTMNLGISSVKKLKILIFIEIRIHLLAKYIFIESLRLNSQRKRKVAKLVEKIYRNDAKNGRILELRTKIVGGAEMGSPLSPLGMGGVSPKPAPPKLLESTPSPLSPNLSTRPLSPNLSTRPPTPNLSSPLPSSPPPQISVAPPQPLLGDSSPSTVPPLGALTQPSPAISPGLLDASPGFSAVKDTSPIMAPTNPPIQKAPEMKVSQEIKDEDEDEELVIYLTYNKLKDVKSMDTLKRLIIDAMKRITHMNSSDNIMIGNPDGTDKGFRKGNCTYSIEVTFSKSEDPGETFEEMKKYITDSILDGSLMNILNVMAGTLSLRDIFFKGIERGIVNKTRFRFKRGIAEIKEKYPLGGSEEKLRFATNIINILYDAIKSIFSGAQKESSKNRFQLELISDIDGEDTGVLVQFMIMDSYSEIDSSYDIAKAIAITAANNKSSITNAVVVDISMIERCYIFDIDTPCNASTKKLIDDKVPNVGLQSDDIVVINNNCHDIVKNLQANYVSNAPLSGNCEGVINKELGITH